MLISRLVLQPQAGRLVVLADGVFHKSLVVSGPSGRMRGFKKGVWSEAGAKLALERFESYDRLTLTHEDARYEWGSQLDISSGVGGAYLQGVYVQPRSFLMTFGVSASFKREPLIRLLEGQEAGEPIIFGFGANSALMLMPPGPPLPRSEVAIMELPAFEDMWTHDLHLFVLAMSDDDQLELGWNLRRP